MDSSVQFKKRIFPYQPTPSARNPHTLPHAKKQRHATTNFPYSRKFPAFLYLFIIPKYITNSSADAKIHATGLARQIPR